MPPRLPPNAVHPCTRDEWRAWLQTHHQRDEGVWLVSYKKASGKPSLGYDAVVEEALCFGWVDSKLSPDISPGRFPMPRNTA
jgi:uncharacterized protein YdeI (YjbR/CyaY-like superfamily)